MVALVIGFSSIPSFNDKVVSFGVLALLGGREHRRPGLTRVR